MKLVDYIRDVHNSQFFFVSFPNELELDRNLVNKFADLYRRGEKEAREFGYNLTYQPHTHEVTVSQVYRGIRGSMDIRTVWHFENFGDMHCHPAASVGHKGGYSPHSLSDFLIFQNHINKPLFIRFVMSGNHVYAVVHRRGFSTIDRDHILQRRDMEAQKISDYFGTNCRLSIKARYAALEEMDSNEAIDIYMTQMKLRTPGFGKFVQRSAMSECLDLCDRCRFGFFKGTHRFFSTVLRRAHRAG